ncbi:MAG: DUF2807 domain-containing protein [Dysgonamonadaceae bacterium]|jgi:hypothetical protein|nr:DUF2807 domain-containing protein [Dysgonamonadaceae bacterium]
MKKVLMSLAVICTTFFCTTACIAGTVVKENRKTEPFSKISAGSCIDVYYTKNDSYSIVVEANEDYIGKIITKVENETLVLKMEGGIKTSIWNLWGKKLLKVHVSAPTLDKVSISGCSDFYADKLKCDNSFQLNASGGSDTKITNLTVAGNVSISISGGADADITNLTVAGNTNISASGGADCNIKNLQTVECNLSASGGSDLDLHVKLSGNLKAKVSGGADINLSGKANDISVSASGGSDVDIRKLTCRNADIHSSGGSDVYK